jgi:hypothetical protein
VPQVQGEGVLQLPRLALARLLLGVRGLSRVLLGIAAVTRLTTQKTYSRSLQFLLPTTGGAS